jgi:cobalt/nickel transport system ATP-binding protein
VTENSRQTVFRLDGVVFGYAGIRALDGLSLTIASGQRVALLGANGSGKSTLLRLLDGLYHPASGTFEAFGAPVTSSSFEDEALEHAFRRRVSLVFQNPDVQLFNPTVFDEVAFGPLHLDIPKSEIRDRVRTVLEIMGIEHLKDRSPHRLSGGEKKRVAIASVLVLDPDVLLLDEPTAALDPSSRSQIIDLVAGWGRSKTVVTATHDLDIVEDIADYAIVLEKGRLAAEGVPAAILRDGDLLARTALVHAHRHLHSTGEAHSHPHRHRGHEH